MTDYRAYLFGVDGHIFRRFDLQCEDDQDAVAAARQHVDGCDVEVWQGTRRVATLPHHDRPGGREK